MPKQLLALGLGIDGSYEGVVVSVFLMQCSSGYPYPEFDAVATNILRLINWLNEVPFAKTKPSRFAALVAS